MGTITRPTKSVTNPTSTSYADSLAAPDAGEWNGDLNTFNTEFNGNIENSNIKAAAAIATSKLAADSGSSGDYWKNQGAGNPPAWGIKTRLWLCGAVNSNLLAADGSQTLSLLGFQEGVSSGTSDSLKLLSSFLTPRAGTVKNFYYEINTAPGAGKSWIFTHYKGGSSVLTLTISGTSTSVTDVVSSVTLAAGDRFYMIITGSGTPAATRISWGIEFV